MRSGRLTSALRRRGGLILVPALVAAGVALLLSLLATPQYRASSEVVIDAGVRSISSEERVAVGSDLLADVRAIVGDDAELSAEIVEGSDVLRFTATSSNAENAAIAANAYAGVFAAPRGDGAQVIEQASVPSDPYEPQTARNTILAFLGGLVVGLIAAVIAGLLDSTIRSSRQLGDITGVPNLAVIPRIPLGEPRPGDLVTLRDPNSNEAEAYRTLRTAVEFLAGDVGATVLLVTSPRPGEGKSSVAANLAVVAAQAGRHVVLIDGDLRKPQVHRSFGIRNDRGLSSVLTGESPMSRSVSRVEAEPNLVVLPSGPPPPDPAELLLSDRLGRAIDALGGAADLVVVDAPPVLPVTDAAVLAQRCDMVLLAATAGLSDRREWRQTLERLGVVQARIIGTVLSRPDSRVEPVPSYRYAPTAAPANWWVAKASADAKRPNSTDQTTVLERDLDDELLAAGVTKVTDSKRSRSSRSSTRSTSGTAPAPASPSRSDSSSGSGSTRSSGAIRWADDQRSDPDRDRGGDRDGEQGGSDGGIERPGTSNGDGSPAADEADQQPLRPPGRSQFPPPKP